ncbi:protein DMP3 [Eucalyptus grandis]|uniref:protein DMP3 n=1 Tax=Eucalyptus grandis TaxID=71139 RepID=UPI00192EDABB|nr:protein DMP3 [Eucalyptus grandis]
MSELRTRTASAKRPSAPVASEASNSSGSGSDHEPEMPKSLQRPSSFSQRAISQTLIGTANLANLLPTGTLLAFQLLMPVFTNNGSCDSATRPLTIILLVLLSVSCFVASFTDSVRSSDGRVFYGFATAKGLYIFDTTVPSTSLPDLSKYKRGFIDWVHALLSMLVFGAVALRDKNVVSCLYPAAGHQTQEVLDIVPVGIGLICSLLFVVFPTRRHGIGYPITSEK